MLGCHDSDRRCRRSQWMDGRRWVKQTQASRCWESKCQRKPDLPVFLGAPRSLQSTVFKLPGSAAAKISSTSFSQSSSLRPSPGRSTLGGSQGAAVLQRKTRLPQQLHVHHPLTFAFAPDQLLSVSSLSCVFYFPSHTSTVNAGRFRSSWRIQVALPSRPSGLSQRG